MARYCTEKFEEATTGQEIIVCWRQDKHAHNAAFITTMEQRLANAYGGVWGVRVNSYHPNLQSCPVNSVNYDDL